MNLIENLKERGITEDVLSRAMANTERVLAIVIQNAAKNVTNAQAMKGNASDLAGDLEVLYKAYEQFGEFAKAKAEEEEIEAALAAEAVEVAKAKAAEGRKQMEAAKAEEEEKEETKPQRGRPKKDDKPEATTPPAAEA